MFPGYCAVFSLASEVCDRGGLLTFREFLAQFGFQNFAVIVFGLLLAVLSQLSEVQNFYGKQEAISRLSFWSACLLGPVMALLVLSQLLIHYHEKVHSLEISTLEGRVETQLAEIQDLENEKEGEIAKLKDEIQKRNDFYQFRVGELKNSLLIHESLEDLFAGPVSGRGTRLRVIGRQKKNRNLPGLREALRPNKEMGVLASCVHGHFLDQLKNSPLKPVDEKIRLRIALFRVDFQKQRIKLVFAHNGKPGSDPGCAQRDLENVKQLLEFGNADSCLATKVAVSDDDKIHIVECAAEADQSDESAFTFFNAAQRNSLRSCLVIPLTDRIGKKTFKYVMTLDTNVQKFFRNGTAQESFVPSEYRIIQNYLTSRMHHEDALDHMFFYIDNPEYSE